MSEAPDSYLDIFVNPDDPTPDYHIPIAKVGNGLWQIIADELWPALDSVPHGAALYLRTPDIAADEEGGIDFYPLADGQVMVAAREQAMYVSDNIIPLTKEEHQLLLMLARNPGEPVTRKNMHQEIWPKDTFYGAVQTIGDVIQRIREKMGKDVYGHPRQGIIRSVQGIGYRVMKSLRDK